MKIELESEDIGIIGIVICLVFTIIYMSSCEQVIDRQVKERLKEERSK
mgnify:CR=1 FL=1